MDNNPEVKKKRGRKKKNDLSQDVVENITAIIEETTSEPAPKKRGRKPKGGKIILKKNEPIQTTSPIANVILHLKCSLSELNEHNKQIQFISDPLQYNPQIPPSIMTYNSNKDTSFFNYSATDIVELEDKQSFAYSEFNKDIDSQKQLSTNEIKIKQTNICEACNNKMEHDNNLDDNVNIKDINQKLKRLKLQLYKNSNPDKKSACFWCTCDFDNQTCYIPKYEMDGQLCGYGSFCRPECAAAYLMKENIDDSTKFERYHLLNQIYSKIYDYKKNIKPAPDPHFLLDKFYGNLSIQEYRKLLKTEHMLLVIEKPMTRILPELHEDNEDLMGGGISKQSSANQGGFYKVKRQSEKQKGPTKTEIMKDNFGF
jgi:hypothetical protein